MKSRFMMLAVTLVAFILGMTGPVGATPPPPAINDTSVLILDTTVIGGAASLEAVIAAAQGFTVDVVDAATWSAMSVSDFASYRAIILGDPDFTTNTGPLAAAEANSAVWGAAIDGNVIIIGTDPRFHSVRGKAGATELTDSGIAFAADIADKTGAYITLSGYYLGVGTFTPVLVLNPFGTFTVRGISGDNVQIVAVGHPALGTLTNTALSNWGQSTHEPFDTFDPSFDPLVIEVSAGGLPYILASSAFVFDAIVVPPLLGGTVEVFSGVEGTVGGNPFIGFTYPFVKPGGDGIVTALCCKFKDPRETDGFGTGRFLHYDPGNLDIKEALFASTVAASDPFDPNCEALLPLIPDGAIIARPWQRINPDPGGGRNYESLAFAQSLEGAFCIVTSTVGVVGPAVTEADPFPLVDYSSECNEDEPEFRPVTGTISIEPRNVETPTADVENADFIQTSTMECDGARSGRRSPISGYWINMRNDLTGNSPFALVNRHYNDLFDEIEALRDGGTTQACVNAGVVGGRIGPLLAQWQLVKKSLNKNKKKPDKIVEFTVPLAEELSRLALLIPDCDDNPNGHIGGGSLAGTLLACSYLGHPDSFDADKIDLAPPGDEDDCLIPDNILITLGLPPRNP